MSTQTDMNVDFRGRIENEPRPALVWGGVTLALFALEAGAVFHFLATAAIAIIETAPVETVPSFLVSVQETAAEIPTLLSRETIPNQGHYDGSKWVGTFMGMSPDLAWMLRVALIYGYSVVVTAWLWVGYDRYRTYYRTADWTPRDDVVDRLRNHYWGLFGLFVVFVFLVMAVFAPALGTTTVDQNIKNPYSNTIEYYDTETDTVEEVTVGEANDNSESTGAASNVGVNQFDDFGRYHPFGTLPSGKDLFTFIVAGSRVSLMIGLLSVLMSATIATVFALSSAYYKGRTDDSLVLLSDAIMAMPQLLLLIFLAKMFAQTWFGEVYNGGMALAVIFAITGWPYLWRSIRGPALQVSESMWVDAARSFGQSPWTIMRKHIYPYILGYLLIYGSMTLGGAIVAVAGLTFITPEIGVQRPTPEWGRAINLGQNLVQTQSWHISLIPGVLITIIVTGFNALGDGIRDAIDPQSEAASAEGEAGGRGGGA
jgi:peptide/nickel transport system permease protein